MNRNSANRRFRAAAAVGSVMLLLFIGFLWRSATLSSLGYDESYNATVAKNLANGDGYSSSYSRIVHFNGEVTTGPVMLLPAAATIWAFGNSAESPHYTATLIVSALLMVVAIVSFRMYGPQGLGAIAVALILLVALTNENDGSAEAQYLALWYTLMGDVPGSLLVVLGCMVLYRSDAPGRPLLAGSLFALAFHTKVVTLIGLMGIVAYLAVFRDQSPYRKRVTLTAALFVPLIVTTALWTAVSRSVAAAHNAAGPGGLDVFMRSGSGISQLRNADDRVALVLENLERNLTALVAHLGGPLVALALAVIAGAAFWRVASARNTVACALFCATAAHLAWWLPFSSTGWIRHLVPCFVYLAFALGITAAQSIRYLYAVVVPAVILLAPQLKDFWQANWSMNRDRKIAIQEGADAVARMKESDDPLLLGCGWWVPRDIEYLLPGKLNFYDCFGRQDWPANSSARTKILVRGDIWNLGKSPRYTKVEPLCPDLLFRNRVYTIWKCPDDFDPTK